MLRHLLVLFALSFLIGKSANAQPVGRSVQMSIYPPPVSDDYYYRIKIYCMQDSSGGTVAEKKSHSAEEEFATTLPVKIIAEHFEHGKKSSSQNVQEGQFEQSSSSAGHQNNDKGMNGNSFANYTNQQNFVEQNKANFIVRMSRNEKENLKQCAKNLVFLEIAKILAVGTVNVHSTETKLLKSEKMSVAQFEQINQFDFDFAEEYSKTVQIVSHLKGQPFEFTLRIAKAAGVNADNFILVQHFVVYKTMLEGRSEMETVRVPITKQHKFSEHRGDIEIKINYKPNGNNNTKESVKVYSINDQMWKENNTFLIDFNEWKVSPTESKNFSAGQITEPKDTKLHPFFNRGQKAMIRAMPNQQ